ncbi:hypothetical protein HZC00_02280 [Candidatus Kaiserbacteria bacterium]|nr:hypothetical protein [Candidatus Kaiserbacteria bacterium]
MRPYRDSRLTQIALVIFFLAVLAYAYFEVRGLLYGPHINIDSSVATSHERYVVISGHADHIASLSVDGAPVSMTQDGTFEVPYLLASGINQITFDARDNYGHTTSKTVEIVYAPSDDSPDAFSSALTPATSTKPAVTQGSQGSLPSAETQTNPNTSTEPVFSDPSASTTSPQ